MQKRKLKRSVKLILAGVILLAILLIIFFASRAIAENTREASEDFGTISTVTDDTEVEEESILTFTMFDVGNGQSIFIDLGDSEVLIDAGRDDEDADKIIKDISDKVGGKLDYIIASTSDADHVGGLAKIYDSFEVGETIYGDIANNPENSAYVSKAKETGNFSEDKDMTITLGPITTLTIYDIMDAQANRHNNSVVCLLKHGNNTFYMAGDLESEGEVLLRNAITDVDVMVLSNHGSNLSNTNLDTLLPKICLASCGKNNEEGYIHKEVLEGIEAISAKCFATYKSGDMTLTSDGERVSYDMASGDKLKISDAGSKVKKKGGK